LARRITPAQWEAVERGLAAVTSRMLSLLPAGRAAALAGGPVTIDLDTTDVEVYGRKCYLRLMFLKFRYRLG
jgi:hypothetical protein